MFSSEKGRGIDVNQRDIMKTPLPKKIWAGRK